MIEMPDGTVLRVRTSRTCVIFIERDDSFSAGSVERWWLPSGDPLTWEQVQERLRAAVEWRVLSAPIAVVDALGALREQFDAAMRQAQECPAGAARAEQVQVALFVERAAQTLAAAAGLAPLDWSRRPEPSPAARDAPTQVLPPVVDAPTVVLAPVTPLWRPGRHARPANRFRLWRDRGRAAQRKNSRWGSMNELPRQNWGA